MIHIITTGGTIEGLHYDKVEDRPQNAPVKINYFLERANVTFPFSVEEAFSKDSRFITLAEQKLLEQRIRSSEADRILITHGTLTMVETTKYLGELNLNKTIVVVGSFILGTAKNTDALFNLGYGICALQILGRGVYIAMNGNVFSWDNVTKNVKQNRFEYIDKQDI